MFFRLKKGGFTLIMPVRTGRKGGSKAFTLIELLVAVAIFSGIIVLALGAFAHSASSSFKSTQIRERTEAARTIVDRIGNDIQYLYTSGDFLAGTTECYNSTGSTMARGLYFNNDCLFMLLQYPDSTGLVSKKYSRSASFTSLELEEARDCSIDVSQDIVCDITTASKGTVISDKYVLAMGSEAAYGDPNQLFTGLAPYEANNQSPKTTGIISLNVVIKSLEVKGEECILTPDPSSHCYTIKTSFVVGD